MIGVETTEEILSGFASSLVLGHYQAGNIVENLLSGGMWPQLIVARANRLLRSSSGRTAFGDGEFLQADLGAFCRTLVRLSCYFVGRRLGEKAKEPGKDRESDATELSLVPMRQQSDAFTVVCLAAGR